METEKILSYLERYYLPRARWWPWKNTFKKIEIHRCETLDEFIYLLIKSDGLIFQLPLLKVNTIPSGLIDRGFCVDGECFVEAEYTTRYLELFLKLSKSQYKAINGEVLRAVDSASPLTLESTNSISLYIRNDERIVLKSYRILPEVNLETQILERLANKRYRYIPRVIGLLFYEGVASGVLMGFVQGKGDGGYPFYSSLVRFLNGDISSNEIGLAAKLGTLVAGLHIALNSDGVDNLFGAEPFTQNDVSLMTNRIERMYKSALRRIDEVSVTLDQPSRVEIEHWRDIAERERITVDEALRLIDEQGSMLLKARSHQDLHLGQMIYTGDMVVDFMITDFEGEPGRTSEERLLKEPLLRDVASMIRSFHYLSHAALMDAKGITRNQASILMIDNDPSREWRLRHIIAFVYSYIADIHREGLVLNISYLDRRQIWRFIYPWIVERAVYELYYESLYRPLWTSIPIAGLVEARKVFQPWFSN